MAECSGAGLSCPQHPCLSPCSPELGWQRGLRVRWVRLGSAWAPAKAPAFSGCAHGCVPSLTPCIGTAALQRPAGRAPASVCRACAGTERLPGDGTPSCPPAPMGTLGVISLLQRVLRPVGAQTCCELGGSGPVRGQGWDVTVDGHRSQELGRWSRWPWFAA